MAGVCGVLVKGSTFGLICGKFSIASVYSACGKLKVYGMIGLFADLDQ